MTTPAPPEWVEELLERLPFFHSSCICGLRSCEHCETVGYRSGQALRFLARVLVEADAGTLHEETEKWVGLRDWATAYLESGK